MRHALLALASLALALLADPAHAAGGERDAERADAAPAPPEEASGWLPSAALHTPLSFGILSEDDLNQAALLMTGVDLDLGLGRRLERGWRLAWELALGLRGTLGVVHRFQLEPSDPQPPSSIRGLLTYVLPLSLSLDCLPAARSGWFGSLHLGAGSFNAPEFMDSGNINLAGRLAGDLGWVLPLETGSLALSARYSLLGLERVYIDEDYDSALQLHELSFGVAWHL